MMRMFINFVHVGARWRPVCKHYAPPPVHPTTTQQGFQTWFTKKADGPSSKLAHYGIVALYVHTEGGPVLLLHIVQHDIQGAAKVALPR